MAQSFSKSFGASFKSQASSRQRFCFTLGSIPQLLARNNH